MSGAINGPLLLYLFFELSFLYSMAVVSLLKTSKQPLHSPFPKKLPINDIDNINQTTKKKTTPGLFLLHSFITNIIIAQNRLKKLPSL